MRVSLFAPAALALAVACDPATCPIGPRTDIVQTDLLAIELAGSTAPDGTWLYAVELPLGTLTCEVTMPMTGDPTCDEGLVVLVADGLVTGLTVLHSGLVDPLDVTVIVRRDGTILASTTGAPDEVVETTNDCPVTQATTSWAMRLVLPA
ncbi:MAG: hypothetical protein H6733_15295 [Alphaproteobacteria bacterium]|nr:hypothetical protein [Alphaproteobacteria bacterium]